MSTAGLVPETAGLAGDGAWKTLRRTGRGRLLVDSFGRLRYADGFSHARSLAFMTSLALLEGLVALVGLAAALGDTGVSRGIVVSIRAAVPGPAGQVLTAAVDQAHAAGGAHRWLALIAGLAGTLGAGMTAMGQLERGLNRIYGVEQDRPMLRKYGLALLLALSAGTLAAAAMASIAFGQGIGQSLHNTTVDRAWAVARWPFGFALALAAIALLFRTCPRRRQPGWSWLAFGALVSVVATVAVTAALGWFFRTSRSFGDAYGPLAGIIALQLWGFAAAAMTLYGAAVAAPSGGHSRRCARTARRAQGGRVGAGGRSPPRRTVCLGWLIVLGG